MNLAKPSMTLGESLISESFLQIAAMTLGTIYP
jgi:hypothetical protein